MRELTDEEMETAGLAAFELGMQADSTLETTLRNLGLDELSPGRVLDLGAGPRAQFQYEASLVFPQTRIISVSTGFCLPFSDVERQSFINEDFKELDPEGSARIKGHILLAAAGYAQQLPFASESFDLVLSHAALPYLLPMEGTQPNVHYLHTFKEALRVTRPSGKVILAPMYDFHAEASEQTLSILGIDTHHFSIEEIPVGDYSNDIHNWFRLNIIKPPQPNQYNKQPWLSNRLVIDVAESWRTSGLFC